MVRLPPWALKSPSSRPFSLASSPSPPRACCRSSRSSCPSGGCLVWTGSTALTAAASCRTPLPTSLGFSLVFIALGVALGAAGALVSTRLSRRQQSRLADPHRRRPAAHPAGLHHLGIVRIPFLDRERRVATPAISPPARSRRRSWSASPSPRVGRHASVRSSAQS